MAPQCVVCGLPLSGALGTILQVAGIGRSSRNPNCCTRCNAHLEEGRLVELTMLFADLSSFTEMTNRLGAEPTYELVDQYLRFASGILTSHGAFIDKYVGDCVMAFFNLPIKTPDHAKAAVRAALELQEKLPSLSEKLGVGMRATVGVATGFARVGRLGSTDAKDYTAIGDVVNLAARLQSQARAGEVLVSDRVYQAVATDYPGVVAETLTLKGFREPNVGYRLKREAGAAGAPSDPAPLAGSRPVSLAGLVLAILGAGCLGVPIAAVAATSLGSSAAALLVGGAFWLDRGPLHLPLLLAAGVTAALSLAALRREHVYRRECLARGSCVSVTAKEKFHNLSVAAMSVVTLAWVGIELSLHSRLWR
ncbi:MAG: adenylate/guanylate cyclase domain-containing protein [Elusimicrobia bacterium]|nr:adenylate/guanylate cyclase domain-containing protein [Elusimicrobiota bacterium]